MAFLSQDDIDRCVAGLNPIDRTKVYGQLADTISRMDYALGLLGETSWWLGWKGRLMGRPILTMSPQIPTACVALDSNGKIDYYFNARFAMSLSSGDIAYIIAHEAMHLVLKHLPRMKNAKLEFPLIWNILTDAYIDEFLDHVLKFRFGVLDINKLDYVLEGVIRWRSLPRAFQEKFPIKPNELVNYSSEELYFGWIEMMEENGASPKEFEDMLEHKKFGKKIKREKRQAAGKEPRKINYEPTPIEPGDIVCVKTKNTYGVVVSASPPTKDEDNKEGKCTVKTLTELKQTDYVFISQALPMMKILGVKNADNVLKLVRDYFELKKTLNRNPTFDELESKLREILSVAPVTVKPQPKSQVKP